MVCSNIDAKDHDVLDQACLCVQHDGITLELHSGESIFVDDEAVSRSEALQVMLASSDAAVMEDVEVGVSEQALLAWLRAVRFAGCTSRIRINVTAGTVARRWCNCVVVCRLTATPMSPADPINCSCRAYMQPG